MHARIRPHALTVVAVLMLAAVPGAAQTTSVRITSPLGRTGVPGVIRVVAQVQTGAARGVVPVLSLIHISEPTRPY